MDQHIRNLIFQLIDQTISGEDFERLQNAIEEHEDVRDEYLRAVNLCESLSEIAAGNAEEAFHSDENLSSKNGREHSTGWKLRTAQIALAATVLVAVGGIAWWLGRRDASPVPIQIAGQQDVPPAAVTEKTIAGYATLRRAVDVQWTGNAKAYFEGDVLSPGPLRIEQGIAEIDFFCGATIVVEGPAELVLESDWSVQFLSGRLRASVPPAARGFVVKAADSEIIDLGTEFALEVGTSNARLEVIDGEVELRGGTFDGDHLVTGEKQWLKGSSSDATSLTALSTSRDVRRRSEEAQQRRFQQWQDSLKKQLEDERLIAWYPISRTQTERDVFNVALTGGDRNGLLVGPVGRTAGRFGMHSAGLKFDRTGSRVRLRIDGDFQAFTFSCWARIDSLDHRYNALFMGDGYENGEPHWQIRDDGCLMFSVMVDDSKEVLHFTEFEQQPVKGAGLHHVYYTKPIWGLVNGGQWFHIAAVYDPVGRQVVQYVNSEEVSREEITDKFHITALRIGPAEIGNWGQPFRQTPWFAVRNLNGTIDELAIYNAVLTTDEIRDLYEQGKPIGY